ncbi:MAG: hypothetical protein HKN29_06310, partial [Rhodothermales bacterium]|nr:hypothetical protein [Rhodothermales bacterium]
MADNRSMMTNPITGSVSNLGKTAVRRIAGREVYPQPPVIPVRHPVVMMHGFGLLASLRRGGHLHREAMFLRSHGVLA